MSATQFYILVVGCLFLCSAGRRIMKFRGQALKGALPVGVLAIEAGLVVWAAILLLRHNS